MDNSSLLEKQSRKNYERSTSKMWYWLRDPNEHLKIVNRFLCYDSIHSSLFSSNFKVASYGHLSYIQGGI